MLGLDERRPDMVSELTRPCSAAIRPGSKCGASAGSAISVGGGSGAINIGVAGKLLIYTSGDVDIGGSGVLNGGNTDATANQPINFQIWGTKTSGVQNISISGNGVLNAIVYAPQGHVTINGGGNSGKVRAVRRPKRR